MALKQRFERANMSELFDLQDPAITRYLRKEVIYFPLGLAGFESVKNYLLLAKPEDCPMLGLQMLGGQQRSFLVIMPGLILSDYQPEISHQDVEFLGLRHPADALALNIVTRHEGGATVNLRGPIVINRRTLIGKQVIPRNAAKFDVRHPISGLSLTARHLGPCSAPATAAVTARARDFKPDPGLAANSARRVTEYYFPNQSAEVQSAENELRCKMAERPESERLRVYSEFSRAVKGLEPTAFAEKPNMILARQRGREIAFPRPVPMVKLSHIVFGYEQWLERKYCLPGFVSVEPGDVVIDCGAYVGGFSLSASKIAKEVHLFEPEEANFACVEFNFKDVNNCVLNMAGLYNKSQTMTLNISASSVEHSLLAPDDGVTIARREIPVVSLYDYCQSRRIETLDFAKIEAEGVELEVFEGLEAIRPRKLAIDVSPERDGESPAEEFKIRLARINYEFRQRGHVLFARPLNSSLNRVKPADEAAIQSKPPRGARRSSMQTVPRQIYSLWLHGVSKAPPWVQWNLARWRLLNPEYGVTALNAEDVAALLQDSGLPWQDMTPQALSDVVRAKLLAQRGGIWVDASVMAARPLDTWLPEAVSQTSFFAFARPAPDRPLSSWFLAGSPEHYLAVKWWEQVRRFWTGRRTLARYEGRVVPPDPVATVSPATQTPGEYPYFWFHYLFGYLIKTDEDFGNQWAACNRLAADPAHALQMLFSSAARPGCDQIQAALDAAPVHKLNWRVNYPIQELDKVLSRRPEL
jgi:FkbM family methyltransferase